jgi:hypothetical protein
MVQKPVNVIDINNKLILDTFPSKCCNVVFLPNKIFPVVLVSNALKYFFRQVSANFSALPPYIRACNVLKEIKAQEENYSACFLITHITSNEIRTAQIIILYQSQLSIYSLPADHTVCADSFWP